MKRVCFVCLGVYEINYEIRIFKCPTCTDGDA